MKHQRASCASARVPTFIFSTLCLMAAVQGIAGDSPIQCRLYETECTIYLGKSFAAQCPCNAENGTFRLDGDKVPTEYDSSVQMLSYLDNATAEMACKTLACECGNVTVDRIILSVVMEILPGQNSSSDPKHDGIPIATCQESPRIVVYVLVSLLVVVVFIILLIGILKLCRKSNDGYQSPSNQSNGDVEVDLTT